jgi:4a-hydroxytetrahydrobiopterin dehydratase
MSQTPILSQAKLAEALRTLPSWTIAKGKLHHTYRFPDFSAAFGWMARVALFAEKSDHHPEWTNVYATVTVDLVTHDAGGITARDVALAKEMDRLAGT